MKHQFNIELENEFRGSKALIRERLDQYDDVIAKLAEVFPGSNVIDIGCGRGEFLEILTDYRFNAQGIDIDSNMVQCCSQNGLNALCVDAHTYLQNIPDNSISLVSLIHVIEHVEFEYQLDLISEIKRVLIPGGILIIETPNPENIVVATRNFYIDPTHLRPIPPSLLLFISKFVGFYRTGLRRLQDLIQENRISLIDVFESVSQDYCTISQKSAPNSILNKFDNIFKRNFGVNLYDVAKKYDEMLNSHFSSLNNSINSMANAFNDLLKDKLHTNTLTIFHDDQDLNMKNPTFFLTNDLDSTGLEVTNRMYQLQPKWAVASISKYDSAFLSGLVINTKPKKIVEIGVASGWGTVMLLSALDSISCLGDCEYYGVDISDRFFYDKSFATGQAISEITPSYGANIQWLFGKSSPEFVDQIGTGIEFAFIDAHHMHPWATLDLIAILPYMKSNSWIALHDINLSMKPDQNHQNRGPKYLYEGWSGTKIHSIELPAMIGAIKLDSDPKTHFDKLIDILYTPWEVTIDKKVIDAICETISNNYGKLYSDKLLEALEIGNWKANKMLSKDIDELNATIGHYAEKLARKSKRTLINFFK